MTNVGQKYHKTPIERELTKHVGSLEEKTLIEIAVTKFIGETATHCKRRCAMSCSRS